MGRVLAVVLLSMMILPTANATTYAPREPPPPNVIHTMDLETGSHLQFPLVHKAAAWGCGRTSAFYLSDSNLIWTHQIGTNYTEEGYDWGVETLNLTTGATELQALGRAWIPFVRCMEYPYVYDFYSASNTTQVDRHRFR